MDNCSEIQRGKERLEVITVLTGFLISLRTLFRSKACIGIVYSWEKVGTRRFLDLTDDSDTEMGAYRAIFTLHALHYTHQVTLFFIAKSASK